MNPFASLPTDQLQEIAAVAFVGVLVFWVLAMMEIERWRRQILTGAPAATPSPRSIPIWRYCPNGHAKVLGDHDWLCPVCSAQMKMNGDHDGLWSAMEAA